MLRFALCASLSLASPLGAVAATIAPPAGAIAQGAFGRAGHGPRGARVEHCSRKADGVRVQGKAREIYMRKCVKG